MITISIVNLQKAVKLVFCVLHVSLGTSASQRLRGENTSIHDELKLKSQRGRRHCCRLDMCDWSLYIVYLMATACTGPHWFWAKYTVRLVFFHLFSYKCCFALMAKQLSLPPELFVLSQLSLQSSAVQLVVRCMGLPMVWNIQYLWGLISFPFHLCNSSFVLHKYSLADLWWLSVSFQISPHRISQAADWIHAKHKPLGVH